MTTKKKADVEDTVQESLDNAVGNANLPNTALNEKEIAKLSPPPVSEDK